MSQISFADAEYAGKRKKTWRKVFLEEMELVVPCKVLLKIIEPHYPVAGRSRRPYALESMPRAPDAELFALSDPAMEEALYEIASLRSFARLSLNEPLPDETTILNFRNLLEAADMLKAINALLMRKGLLLKRGSIVDATIIAAPSSTKNARARAGAVGKAERARAVGLPAIRPQTSAGASEPPRRRTAVASMEARRRGLIATPSLWRGTFAEWYA